MMNSYFECDNIGDLKEYVEWSRTEKEINLFLIVQSIIIRSFIDEYGIEENPRIEIPASSSDSFSPVMDGHELNEVDQKAPWYLDITREVSRNFMKANQTHLKAKKKADDLLC
jgi:hypothetical protein